jgi:phage terminase small subunit
MIIPRKLIIGRPPKPAGITEEASKHWDEIIDEVDQKSVLRELHGPLLVALCESYVIYDKLRAIYRESLLCKDAKGRFAKTPFKRHMVIALRAYNRQRKNFHLKPLRVPRVRRYR